MTAGQAGKGREKPMPLIYAKDGKHQHNCLNGDGRFARWMGVPSVTE